MSRLAVKDWIARSTKQGQSDIYVFFAGHGLAISDDGEEDVSSAIRWLTKTAG